MRSLLGRSYSYRQLSALGCPSISAMRVSSCLVLSNPLSSTIIYFLYANLLVHTLGTDKKELAHNERSLPPSATRYRLPADQTG
jgi:hypothetical protein